MTTKDDDVEEVSGEDTTSKLVKIETQEIEAADDRGDLKALLKRAVTALENQEDEKKLRENKRALILQCKRGKLSVDGVHGEQSVALFLDTEDELSAALALEHEGLGRVMQEEGEWVFRYGESSGDEGQMQGSSIFDKRTI